MANNKDFKVKNGIKPTVYHEGVGTVTSGSVGYSLSATSYDSVSLDVSAQENNPTGVFFKPDGTKLYIVGLGGDEVNEYTLSTAWDITTASANYAFSVLGQDTDPRGITFKPDGTEMYICGDAGNDINQYTLSTAWDLSTASYTRNFSVSGQTTIPRGIHFKTDGTKMFVSGSQNTLEYSLSTAWDISTASYTQAGADVSPSYNAGLFFASDGLTMYKGVWFGITTSIYKYTLSTAWDLSTATFTEAGEVQNEAGTTPFGVYLKSDGTKMWVVGNATDTLYQYSTTLTTNTLDLSTGSVFEITPTSDIQIGLSNPAASGTVSAATLLLDGANTNTFDLSIATQETSVSVSSQSTLPQGLFFKSDGTKMYVCDGTNRDVFQYSLSTAWDVSTASYDSVFADFGGQDTDPRGIFFKDDGTKFYLCGDAGNDVNEYSLSTAWDISTRSFTTSFSVSSQDTEPQGIYFKPDGTKFYIAGANSSDIYQYALTTAWDISTASYESKSLNVSSQDGVVQDIWLNNDGTKAFVLGGANDALYQYSLSTAYDISTASYDSVTIALSGVDTSVEGLFFKSDGSKFYFVGGSTDKVYQYSCASAATITYDSTLQWGGGTAPDSPAANETDVITFTTRDGGTTYQAAIAIDGAA
jgi:sugar lactone lactonase YvrE